jgi:hypothetical protein
VVLIVPADNAPVYGEATTRTRATGWNIELYAGDRLEHRALTLRWQELSAMSYVNSASNQAWLRRNLLSWLGLSGRTWEKSRGGKVYRLSH